ncbi:hypothetical protein [Leptolyngbya sp. GGD]|uniref:hypothetical protein n=1 Tax=Leptolyngbya sp. GGD TaxID=2997907 RepID=UPI00227AD660|nr:hypothetical protein [Leptolyngbya sp. GGD]MCY6492106.1 hypothetical protein [Leptolyngbya sp. GGD]
MKTVAERFFEALDRFHESELAQRDAGTSEAIWLLTLAEAQREAAIAEFDLTEAELSQIEQELKQDKAR